MKEIINVTAKKINEIKNRNNRDNNETKNQFFTKIT